MYFFSFFTVCGGHLSATTNAAKIFSHAKFGDVNYENKEDCDWIIEAPPGFLFLFFNRWLQTSRLTQNGRSTYTPVEFFIVENVVLLTWVSV